MRPEHRLRRERLWVIRFWLCVRIVEGGCWEWTGALDEDGYGVFKDLHWRQARPLRAHRVSYEQFVGPIPDGLTLDHLCRNRRCVSPAHLEAVPNAVNVMRGDGVGPRNAAKTHCKRGHPFTAENVREWAGQNHPVRVCAICADINQRARRERDPQVRARAAAAAREKRRAQGKPERPGRRTSFL